MSSIKVIQTIQNIFGRINGLGQVTVQIGCEITSNDSNDSNQYFSKRFLAYELREFSSFSKDVIFNLQENDGIYSKITSGDRQSQQKRYHDVESGAGRLSSTRQSLSHNTNTSQLSKSPKERGGLSNDIGVLDSTSNSFSDRINNGSEQIHHDAHVRSLDAAATLTSNT